MKHLKVKATYGSIFEAYVPECYYFDLIDLVRRLILTGGLILIGHDEAVAQIFLGILISAMWLSLVLYAKPYASWWDTALSAVLSFSLLLTLVSGVSLRLYELTLNDANTYQRAAFGAVLTTVVVLCILLSLAAMLMSAKWLRRRVRACCSCWCSAKGSGHGAFIVVQGEL